MTQILNARVQQKVTTEANWIAEEDAFGVILAGEQAFVTDDSGNPINFKIGDGTKKFSELPYWIQYNGNVLNQKRLAYINQNIDITVAGIFRNYTCLYDIILINEGGSDIDFKVGTTAGGNELMEGVVGTSGVYAINLRKVFQAATTLYFSGLAGNTFTMFLVYYQYDETPATPPVGGDVAFKWPKNFQGQFVPLGPTDLDDNWDFSTGTGKAGTPYANCVIAGTNGTEDMGGFYPVGWKVGNTLYPTATTFGNTTGQITIAEANIPKFRLKLFSGAGPAGQLAPDATGIKSVAWSSAHTANNQDYDMKGAADDNPSMGHTSSFGVDAPAALDVRPKSKVVLYFVAIS